MNRLCTGNQYLVASSNLENGIETPRWCGESDNARDGQKFKGTIDGRLAKCYGEQPGTAIHGKDA